MPNHCANTLKITATNPDSFALLCELRQHLKLEDKKIFQIIRPCPEELMNATASFSLDDTHNANIEKYGYAHWYDFCNTEWGTKWDAYEIDVMEDKEDTLTISFDTAWSPPIGIYETLHEMGFAVEATFVECGCDFIGYWIDGHDHTESLSAIADTEETHEDMMYHDYFDLSEYFAGHGITHAPAHFGG